MACSNNETPQPAKVQLICPQTTECRAITTQTRTNGQLAQSLNNALDMIEVCIIANDAKQKCIDSFNNQ
ncbi:Rz1-like lysis system protein LysC [Aggregatibacter actinomycetemcomitans]|uniref:Rz1-like lysis system protein LysC n=1 Tax=Aggregatibacter actinomycetemcomitans TaxID=714 RepID=UPI00355C09CF